MNQRKGESTNERKSQGRTMTRFTIYAIVAGLIGIGAACVMLFWTEMQP